MYQKLVTITAILCSTLMLSTITYASPKATQIVSFKVIPVQCHFPGCSAANHGNLKITFSNKSSKIIDNSGLVNNDAKDAYRCPQISPDHKTIGWITDTHMIMDSGTIREEINLSKAKTYKPTEKYENIQVFQISLNLYRNGKKLPVISPGKPFIISWIYWDNGTKVAIESMANHGASTLELFDTVTGKQLAEFNENDKNLPKWAEVLSSK